MFSHQDNLFSLVDALSAIRLLTRLPVEGGSEQDLIHQALKALVEYQELECGSLFLLREGALQCAAGISVNRFGRSGSEQYARDIQSVVCAGDEGIMGQACKTRLIQYYRNCQEEALFTPFERTWLCPSGGALMSLPVTSDDELLGVFNISHHLPEFFETWHQHFLILFASVLGRFIHLQRVLADARDQVRVLGQELARVRAEQDGQV